MFSEELKKNTAVAHLELERKMIPLLKQISSKEDYVELLDFLYGYYQPLESKIKPFVTGINFHQHTPNIEKDIIELEPTHIFSGRVAEDVPDFNSAEKALGALYVLEGSTLGGQIISKMLAKQITGSSVNSFSFYNPYGDETHQKWSEFKKLLDANYSAEQRELITQGANETFSTLHKWMLSYGGSQNN
ncbi:MAG: biliverdin-producing heme oxygenase [Chitinophagaceae bacterium]|nr:MAG: biliverdin-producing heme oxygenase [Chitinophagaceae bacterium]